jgi:hypothetical protein
MKKPGVYGLMTRALPPKPRRAGDGSLTGEDVRRRAAWYGKNWRYYEPSHEPLRFLYFVE